MGNTPVNELNMATFFQLFHVFLEKYYLLIKGHKFSKFQAPKIRHMGMSSKNINA